MWTLQEEWMSSNSSWQKEDAFAGKSSPDDDTASPNPLCHSNPMWWATGTQSDYLQLQRDVVRVPNCSGWKKFLGTGSTSSQMALSTMHAGFHISSQWNTAMTFFLTGMHGILMSNQFLWLQMSLLQTSLNFLRSLWQFQSCLRSDDRQDNRKSRIALESVRRSSLNPELCI